MHTMRHVIYKTIKLNTKKIYLSSILNDIHFYIKIIFLLLLLLKKIGFCLQIQTLLMSYHLDSTKNILVPS